MYLIDVIYNFAYLRNEKNIVFFSYFWEVARRKDKLNLWNTNSQSVRAASIYQNPKIRRGKKKFQTQQLVCCMGTRDSRGWQHQKGNGCGFSAITFFLLEPTANK